MTQQHSEALRALEDAACRLGTVLDALDLMQEMLADEALHLTNSKTLYYMGERLTKYDHAFSTLLWSLREIEIDAQTKFDALWEAQGGT